MGEDESKKEDFEFTPEGEALGYISLDQARVLAVEFARDNTDFYGRRYRGRTLVWEVTSSEETEDYYQIRLSFRPAGRFRGQAGIEQFLIEKTGEVRVRQLLDEPSYQSTLSPLIGLGLIMVAAGGIAVGALFALGTFDAGGGPPTTAGVPSGSLMNPTIPPNVD